MLEQIEQAVGLRQILMYLQRFGNFLGIVNIMRINVMAFLEAI